MHFFVYNGIFHRKPITLDRLQIFEVISGMSQSLRVLSFFFAAGAACFMNNVLFETQYCQTRIEEVVTPRVFQLVDKKYVSRFISSGNKLWQLERKKEIKLSAHSKLKTTCLVWPHYKCFEVSKEGYCP